MNMNNVKEKSVDKVIPYINDKSVSIDKESLEQTITYTLIRLEHYLKRIKKYSIKDFTSNYPDGLLEEDGSGVFNEFLICEYANGIKLFKCRFYYWEGDKTLCFQYSKKIETGWYFIDEEDQEVLGFRKSKLRDVLRIRKISIWVASNMFSDWFDEKELKEIFLRGVFAKEHRFIDWEGYVYPYQKEKGWSDGGV